MYLNCTGIIVRVQCLSFSPVLWITLVYQVEYDPIEVEKMLTSLHTCFSIHYVGRVGGVLSLVAVCTIKELKDCGAMFSLVAQHYFIICFISWKTILFLIWAMKFICFVFSMCFCVALIILCIISPTPGTIIHFHPREIYHQYNYGLLVSPDM